MEVCNFNFNFLTFKPDKFPKPVRFIFILSLVLSTVFTSCKSTKKTTKSKTSETSKTEKKHHETSEKKENKKEKQETNLKEKHAKLVGASEKEIDNIKLYQFIDEWLDVPYKYGGNTKSGIDCSNFTSLLYKNVYHKEISGSSADIFSKCETINKEKLKEGDLVFFKIDNKKISHIGVYLMNNKFVHATTKKGVMINDLNEPYYKKYFFKAGKLK